MMDRAQQVLALKGVAIVGVVFHHLGNRRLDPHAREVVADLATAFSWCVLVFMALSGWLHAYGEERRSRSIGGYLASRVRRLLLPFLALILIYSAIWQLIQYLDLLPLSGNVPASFSGKVLASVWPVSAGAVAEQLYFLPMLFCISIGAQLLFRSGGLAAMAVATALLLAWGLAQYPATKNVGFLPGVFVWSGFCYLAGFLMFRLRSMQRMRTVLVGLGSASVLAFAGVAEIAKAVPLLALLLVGTSSLESLPVLPRVGEASGTIFAYHTPFLIQPLMLLVSTLPGWGLQLAGSLLASALAIAACTAFYFLVRGTRYRPLLL